MKLTQGALVWLSIILQDRFGHVFNLAYQNEALVMRLEAQEGSIIFPNPTPAFTQASTNAPCSSWNAEQEGFTGPIEHELPAPCVAKLPSPLIEVNTDSHQAAIHYDILGLTYWMLNRIEEMGSTELDNHGRFPASSSHALKHGYLERPIVDEWLDILGQVIKRVWPSIELKQHVFSMQVTHDVDAPSRYGFSPWLKLPRAMAGGLLKSRDWRALFAPLIRLQTRHKLHPLDPFNTFDWLMNKAEEQGRRDAFYFICGRTSKLDAQYDPEYPAIRELMRRIHARGHEIGLHPSYNTYQTPERIKQEADRLRNVMKEEGVEQDGVGGRMHYLRWEHPTTLQAWDDAGMLYDTTLSYADRPGFRCGTCFEYPAFNATTQRQLKLRVQPLIAMECTIIAERYLGLGYTQEAFNKFTELKDKCKKVNGQFTLLWHNSHFQHKADFEMYEKILAW